MSSNWIVLKINKVSLIFYTNVQNIKQIDNKTHDDQ